MEKKAKTESIRNLKIMTLSTQRLERLNHRLMLVTWRLERRRERILRDVRKV